jgi:hypothetical protein
MMSYEIVLVDVTAEQRRIGKHVVRCEGGVLWH